MTLGENRDQGKTSTKELKIFVWIMNKQNKSAFRERSVGGEEK